MLGGPDCLPMNQAGSYCRVPAQMSQDLRLAWQWWRQRKHIVS